MDEEQKRKFKVWMDTTGRVYRTDFQDAWEACLDANKVEEKESHPTKDEILSEIIDKAKNHYWDSLEPNRDMVLLHLKQILELSEDDPSTTEMVSKLFEMGWSMHPYYPDKPDNTTFYFMSPEDGHFFALVEAYHRTFPRKKKIEVEVWLQQCPDNKHKVRETGYFGIAGHDLWTKGIATFWVEEEQPCSEDGLS